MIRRGRLALSIVLLILALLVQTHASAQERVRAFRRIYFGYSPDDVEALIYLDSAFSKVTRGRQPPVWVGATTTIAGKVHYVVFDFFEYQLFRVTFQGPGYRLSSFKAAVEDAQTLARIIELTYGPPGFQRDLRASDVLSGYVAFSHIWKAEEIGEPKAIKIGVAEIDLEYSAYMEIEYLPLVEAQESQEQAQKEVMISKHAGDF